MSLCRALIIVFALAIVACSPAAPTPQQNSAAKQTPTPTKDKSIRLNDTGWAP